MTASRKRSNFLLSEKRPFRRACSSLPAGHYQKLLSIFNKAEMTSSVCSVPPPDKRRGFLPGGPSPSAKPRMMSLANKEWTLLGMQLSVPIRSPGAPAATRGQVLSCPATWPPASCGLAVHLISVPQPRPQPDLRHPSKQQPQLAPSGHPLLPSSAPLCTLTPQLWGSGDPVPSSASPVRCPPVFSPNRAPHCLVPLPPNPKLQQGFCQMD